MKIGDFDKQVYLVRGGEDESYEVFVDRIKTTVTTVGKQVKPVSLRFAITDRAPPRLSIIPFSREKMAAISIRKSDEYPADLMLGMEGLYGAYRVEEAVPIAYEKDWVDGYPTPGACLLTLFCKRKDIDYDTFIRRWHHGHTPLSVRVHPLWNYVRNVVTSRLTDKSACFDGIVEENFKRAADLLNPLRFFGNPAMTPYRMLQVYMDTKSFIDYQSMETYLTTEYHVIS